jgi:predicted O-methyltransferase YrrM
MNFSFFKILPCSTNPCRNAQALKGIILSHNVKSIIEIGSWLGDSAIWMATHLPSDGQIICVDHFKGSPEMITFQNLDQFHAFCSNIKHAGDEIGKKITPLVMTSKLARDMLDLEVDMIYIDAAHDEASVYEDITLWHPFLKPNGIMCGDDTIHPIFGDAVLKACTRFTCEKNLDLHTTPDFWWYEKL